MRKNLIQEYLIQEYNLINKIRNTYLSTVKILILSRYRYRPRPITVPLPFSGHRDPW